MPRRGHVDLDGIVVAEPLELAFLHHAQQHDLRVRHRRAIDLHERRPRAACRSPRSFASALATATPIARDTSRKMIISPPV